MEGRSLRGPVDSVRNLQQRQPRRCGSVARDANPDRRRSGPRLGVLHWALCAGSRTEVVQYEDAYRLCYIRGPEGLLIGLAQELG